MSPTDPFTMPTTMTLDYGRSPLIVEVMAAEVWLLSCGCIAAQSSKEDRLPPYTRSVHDRDFIHNEPMRAVVTINTAQLTGDLSTAHADHHGRPLVQLPVVEWHRQAELEGIPSTLRRGTAYAWQQGERHP